MNKNKEYFLNKIDNLKSCLSFLENNKFFYDTSFYNLYHLKLVQEIKSLESYLNTL